MALKLVPTSQFKKDNKRVKKRGLDMGELQAVPRKQLLNKKEQFCTLS